MSEKREFRSIFKATSVLGSVQVFNILIAILRSKVIALLLGPTGMGIASLFNTTLNLFTSVSGLGIDKSAVKDISFEKGNDNKASIEETIALVKRLSWYAGFLTVILMIVLSSFLSRLVFDSENYSSAFVWLSLALLFKQLSQTNLAVLQGLRKISNLAKANLLGSVFGLFIAIPLYYFWRLDGIVPAIIVMYFVVFLISYYFQKKYTKPSDKPFAFNVRSDFIKGKAIIKLGLLLSFGGVFSTGTSYAFQIYLREISSLEIVGFYMAGMAILNQYVNIVFNAMGTDYYPRLASVHDNNDKVRTAIQQQALVSVLIITPVVALFLALAPMLIKLLYSSEFLAVVPFVKWGILGMLLKAVSFSIGYAFIAKGDSKVFLKTAVIFNLMFLALNIVGYHLYGLKGLGISFLVYYAVHLIGVFVIANKRYGFYFKRQFYGLYLTALALCLGVFLSSFIQDLFLSKVSMWTIAAVSVIFALYWLNRIMDLKELFQRKK